MVKGTLQSAIGKYFEERFVEVQLGEREVCLDENG
jgi:hypothetical protein